MADAASADEVHRVISTAFDPTFYRAANPDLHSVELDPLRHYLEHGSVEGRDPAPWFSVKGYLRDHPDVAETGVEPLFHYLTVGRFEGRAITPSDRARKVLEGRLARGGFPTWSFEPWSWSAPSEEELAEADASLDGPPVSEAERSLVATEFDEDFYVTLHPDVCLGPFSPLEHFLRHGWREGRNPCAWFSIRDYLEANPDVAASGENAFAHYLRAGRAEGRAPRNALGFRHRIISRTPSMEKRLAVAAKAAACQAPQTDAVFAEALEAAQTGLRRLHVTFSHDDYTQSLGGVQVCLQRESARIAELGRDHLHFYPASGAPPVLWPMVRAGREAAHIGVVLNGRPAGVYTARVIARVLAAKAPSAAERRSFAIHSLLGHNVDEVGEILSALRMEDGFFWLHDFASLCAGYHLLRNDVEDCGAPPHESAACGVCLYGPWRSRHLDEHARLFEDFRLTVVSPSETTLAFWRQKAAFPIQDAIVHPHAQLRARKAKPTGRDGPLRVAFLGMPAAHKGWPVFEDLVLGRLGDARYEFLHLGARPIIGFPAEFHPMSVTAERPQAMREALEALEVDAVLIWPLCRETFSFTAYEAAAAGAAVITWPDSGNVAAFVEGFGCGVVLPSEAALAEAFETGTIVELSRLRRQPKLYELEFSGMTADLLHDDGVLA